LLSFAWARNAEYGTSTELLVPVPNSTNAFHTSSRKKIAHETRPGSPARGGGAAGPLGFGGGGPCGDGSVTREL
jgi:hypothetical protein